MQQNKKQLFYFVTMAYWFSLYMYIPILGPYVERLGGSLQMVGLVVGSYGFTQMLLRIPLGIFSDKIRRRRVFISIGLALALTSSWGIGLVSTPWLVLIFRSIAGAAAATWVIYTVLFSSYFKPEDAPKAMGVIVFYTILGQMLATTSGGFVADYYGWTAPFVIGGLVGLLGLIASTQIKESKVVHRQPVKVSELLTVGKDKVLLSVSFLAILYQCIMFSTVYGFTPMYAVTIGASPSQLSILALVSSLPQALSALKSGVLAERFGERKLLIGAFVIVSIFSLVIPFTTNLLTLYISQAIAGFGRGVIFPVLMGLSIKSITNEKRATAMGFFQSIYALGMFAGPVLVGIISEHSSLLNGFVFIGLVGLVGAVLSGKLLAFTQKLVVTNSSAG